MLSDGEIADICYKGDSGSKKLFRCLLNSALKKGGRDNITVILCEVMNQKENWSETYMEPAKKT